MPEPSYIRFEKVSAEDRKTGIWAVYSTSGSYLGIVKFYGAWRCFTFWPEPSTIFNAGCLTDIAAFCQQQTDTWRQAVATRSR